MAYLVAGTRRDSGKVIQRAKGEGGGALCEVTERRAQGGAGS